VRTSFIEQLFELAAKDPRIMLVVGDLGFGVVTRFMNELPQQFINAGVAEQNMTGIAAGLALSGRIVFTYSIANFPTVRCLEQLRNDVCYHKANVKVIAIGGGLSYGSLGVSHHATEDLAFARALPNLTVLAPNDASEAAAATRAIAKLDGPCYMRLDRSTERMDWSAAPPFQLGRARTVRDGTDLTIIAAGGLLRMAVEAADVMATKGLGTRVISMHTIKPLDEQAIRAAATETNAIFTLEEHSITGGLGSAVAEFLSESQSRGVPFLRLGLPPEFSSKIGDQAYLRAQYGLDVPTIVRRVTAMLPKHEHGR
jgi:transketolase